METDVLSQHVQNCFIALSIVDNDFLKRTVDFIDPTYFGSVIAEDFLTLCQNYYRQYKRAPGNHFQDELDRFIRNTKDNARATKKEYVEYGIMLSGMEVPNKKYVLDRVDLFVRTKVWEGAALEFNRMTTSGQLLEAKQYMYDVLKKEIGVEDIGLDYFSTKIPTYYDLLEEDEFLFKFGIPIIDQQVGGLKRSQLITIMGPPKGGKSWVLFHLGVQALRKGLNVLHISHEVTTHECEQRYDMMISTKVSRREPQEVRFITRTKTGEPDSVYTKKVDTIWEFKNIQKPRAALKWKFMKTSFLILSSTTMLI
jgi:hypothetical protein